jgi:hypothetical protein
VSTAKGVETDSRMTMSSVLEHVLADALAARVSVLSGPSFAREVALEMPTAVTAAARSLDVAEELQRLFNGPAFRVYTSVDMVGVEIGGAVKNVIALAAGVSDGLGFGSNTRAAPLTSPVSTPLASWIRARQSPGSIWIPETATAPLLTSGISTRRVAEPTRPEVSSSTATRS